MRDLDARLARLERDAPKDPRASKGAVINAFLADDPDALRALPPSPIRDHFLATLARIDRDDDDDRPAPHAIPWEDSTP